MSDNMEQKEIKPADQVDFWQETICKNFFGLEITPNNYNKDFFGLNKNGSISDIQLSFISSEGQNVVRSHREIKKDSDGFFLLCFQRSGKVEILQDNRSTVLYPGDWAICDSTRPFTLSFPDIHDLNLLKIPIEKISGRLALPEKITAQGISGKQGLGKINQVFIQTVWEELAKGGDTISAHLDEMIIELLSSCLNERFKLSDNTARSHVIKLVELKTFIRQQIKNPELCSDMAADALHISTRYLHLLFQQEEKTFSEYIRDIRLQGCRRSLEDPFQKHYSITDIAFSWGFNSSSHFCKLFKKRFTRAPSEFRKAACKQYLKKRNGLSP